MISIIEKIQRDTFPILFGICVIVLAIMAIVTGQMFMGLLLVIAITVVAIMIYLVRSRASEPGSDDETLIILAGVIVALLSMAIAPWVAWAIAFMFLFLCQKSFTRIEKRLDAIDTGSFRRNARRRGRHGPGGRYR
jgi:hypothetical protein